MVTHILGEMANNTRKDIKSKLDRIIINNENSL